MCPVTFLHWKEGMMNLKKKEGGMEEEMSTNGTGEHEDKST